MINREYITKFEAYLLTEKRVAHNTRMAYGQDLKQFLAYMEKNNISIEEITLDQIKKFLDYLYKLALSARSVARKIAALKGLFFYLSQRFAVPNLAQELLIPKIPKRLPTYLSEEEMELLFTTAEKDKSLNGKRNCMMLYLMYVTGMRVTELTSLKVHQIQLDEARLLVDGKGNKQRVIPLPQTIITLLKNYLKDTHRKFCKKHGDTAILFPIPYRKKIKSISRQSFWGILKQIWRKTGINHSISPHTLRHSFATHILKKGANLRSLQLLLGHEQVSTVEIYTHIETKYLREIYDKKHPRS